MLGSLSVYRRVLNDNYYNPRRPGEEQKKLPTLGHAAAGIMAGWTVSFIAGPVEHIKARLQVQYQADKGKRLYSGPIDCTKKIVGEISSVRNHVRTSNTCISSQTTVFAASTMVSAPLSSSEHSSVSGGVPTMSSPAPFRTTPTSLPRPSTSGPVDSPHRSSGSPRIRAT
jgi:hypothetical protein